MARTSLACSAILVSLHGPVSAEDSREFEWSATVSATSDYVFRGFSLTDERPALQPSFDVSYGKLYAGVWGSDVSDGGYEPVEVDLYAGIKPEWGQATFDFGAVWYTYPGASPGPLGFQYVELKAGTSFSPIADLKLNPIFWYVPDQRNEPVTYTFEGALTYELRAVGVFKPTLGGLVGYTHAGEADWFAPGVDHYAYWNAGIAVSVKKLTFDFRYWDTSIAGDELANEFFELTDTSDYGLAAARFVFTTSIALP